MKFINDINLNTNSISKGSFEVVTTLPNTDLFVGRQVIYNNKIYIYTSNGWRHNSQITRKTSSQWSTENPVLLDGELGYDTTSKRYKIGNGTTAWNKLKYDIDLGVISKGQQLIINGNGVLGDNTNFSQMTYDPTTSFNGSPGVFTASYASPLVSDEFIPIDGNKKYKLSLDIQSVPDTISTYNYMMLIFYDIDKKEIKSNFNMYFAGSTTKLVRDLNPGDTEIYVDDLSGWVQKTQYYQRKIIFWDYKNSYGYQYPKETYSRYWKASLWTEESQLDYANNKIILDSPWNQEPHLAGCDVSQGSDGASYKYLKVYNVSTLTHWQGYIQGFDYSGGNVSYKFPPGTAFAKFGMLVNYYNIPDVKVAISNVRLDEMVDDLELTTETLDFKDTTEIVTTHLDGYASYPYQSNNFKLFRRKASNLWNYIKSKLSSNLKTVGGNSIVGTGNITFKTINNQALIGNGNISIEEDSHDVALNDINEDGLEWYLVPVCDDNVGIDNSNTTYLYAKDSIQPNQDRFLYNRELNAILCNIYASDVDTSIIDVTENKSIDFRSIVGMLCREGITYIYSLDDFQSWLITLNGSNTTPTKSISTMISEGIAKVVANAPASFDTLKEIADWISTHQNDASAMNTAINNNTTNITNLTAKVNTNTTNISTNTTQISGIKEDITSINSILQSLSNEINTLKTELQNAKAEIAYLKSVAPIVTAEDGFYVVDANDYIGFKVDNNGATDSATTIETTNLDE